MDAAEGNAVGSARHRAVDGDVELLQLSRTICEASRVDELGHRIEIALKRLFGVSMYGFYVVDAWTGTPRLVKSANVSDAFLARYERYGRPVDPLQAHTAATGEAAYNLALMPMEEWLESPLYLKVSQLHDLRHLVQAPVVAGTGVVGSINFGTSDPGRGFTPHEVQLAEALGRVAGATIERIYSAERLERERDRAQVALDLTGVSVVVSEPGMLEPRLNEAARRLLRRVVGGETLLYQLLARPGGRSGSRGGGVQRGGFSRHVQVRLAAGGSGLLYGHSSPAGGPADALVTVLELQLDESEICERTLLALTPREREVVLRVVEGLTDREIADRLCLSPHTVTQHVKRAYRKLGVDSRVSLTRLLLGPGDRRG